MKHFEDTICAPATPVGGGAISIIRVSGPDALRLADSIVQFHTGAALSSEGYTLKYGTIPGVDEVLVSIFRAPHSYTGEDSVEISCHASSYIVQKILLLLVAAGGRMAEAGEFTRRAFVNGKMDLSQAEAVADLIASGSELSHKVALSQLKGSYSSELKELRERLVELASLLELELDFSEEEVEFADRAHLQGLLDKATAHVEKLVDSFRTGNAIRNGVPVAIVGAVNAGKSTLLNALVGEDRAIVSDVPGTTRDTIEETVTLGGILFRFIDTAGLRESSDRIEKIGIDRSYASIAKAQTVVAVLDGCAPLPDVQKSFAAIAARLAGGDKKLIVLRNKVDSYDAIAPEEFPKMDRSYNCFELKYPAFGTYELDPEALAGKLSEYLESKDVPVPEGLEVLDVSARTGEGLDMLKERLVASAGLADWNGASLVTNLRHYEALERALDSLRQVSIGLDRKSPTDLIAQDLRDAIAELGSIFGAVTTEDLLKNIFSRFCIGK
ncbi:MAG: tRNA uridine-5-carboxymethylaminomethyl(34) synthesis GTPase MnmE [Bacteroidales bacterium]|nr:tRNA uridine-5-carboxymethylaminomethyl(34) synthesis GTPase MnmE [Bacteroidales bacterium]